MPGTEDSRLHAAAAAVLPALLWFAAAPFGSHPVNDDWQTYWSAFHFAQTGEARIADYSAMGMVGWSVPAGLVAKVTGESFFALRLLSMAALAFTGWAAWGLARELGAKAGAALGVALVVTASPVVFWLSTTCMTDAPWNALWVGSLWLCARGLRTGRTLDFALGAAAAVWAAWIRIPVAAVPIALGTATWVARSDGAVRRRALAASAVVLVVGVAGFTAWYELVHGTTSAYRYKSGLDLGRMARGVPGGVFACVAYAGFFLVPLAPWALSRAGSAARGAAIAAAVLGVTALVHAKTGILTPIHKSMPYLPNIAYDLGLGPMTVTDVLREGGDPPVSMPGAFQVLCGAGLAALGGALTWLAIRRVADAVRNRRDPVTVFVAFATLLYAGSAVLFAKPSAPLFDRYLVPMIAPLAAILVAPRTEDAERPASALVRWSGRALFAAVTAFAVLGTRDFHAFTRARFELADAAMSQAGTARRVDGGFEFDCWWNYGPASRGEFTPDPAWKGWLVERPDWVVATRERSGYEVVERRPVFFTVGLKRWDLLLLRRLGG